MIFITCLYLGFVMSVHRKPNIVQYRFLPMIYKYPIFPLPGSAPGSDCGPNPTLNIDLRI